MVSCKPYLLIQSLHKDIPREGTTIGGSEKYVGFKNKHKTEKRGDRVLYLGLCVIQNTLLYLWFIVP